MSAAGRSEWLGPRARPAEARATHPLGARPRPAGERAHASGGSGPQGSPCSRGSRPAAALRPEGATDLRDPELELRGSSRSGIKPSKVCELCSHRRSGPVVKETILAPPVTTVKITSPSNLRV